MTGIIFVSIMGLLLIGIMVNQIGTVNHISWIIDDMEMSKEEYERELYHRKWEGWYEKVDLRKGKAAPKRRKSKAQINEN